jgi:hypothetical protein
LLLVVQRVMVYKREFEKFLGHIVDGVEYSRKWNITDERNSQASEQTSEAFFLYQLSASIHHT